MLCGSTPKGHFLRSKTRDRPRCGKKGGGAGWAGKAGGQGGRLPAAARGTRKTAIGAAPRMTDKLVSLTPT